MFGFTLASLSEGECAAVRTVALPGEFKRRLFELGFTPGTQVRCIRKAPSGSPVAFSVKGAVIALRNEDCGKIYGTVVG